MFKDPKNMHRHQSSKSRMLNRQQVVAVMIVIVCTKVDGLLLLQMAVYSPFCAPCRRSNVPAVALHFRKGLGFSKDASIQTQPAVLAGHQLCLFSKASGSD